MMKHKAAKFGLPVLVLAIATVVVGLSHPQPQPKPKAPEPSLLVQVNDVRAKAGKPPLVEDPKLDQAAQMKVDDQVARNYWTHQLPGGGDPFTFEHQVYPVHGAGAENLAKCQTTDSQRVNDWVHSPEHYATMVGDFTAFGYAEKVNPKDNNCVYTVTYFLNE